jgi:hypothetical protein
MTKQLIMAVTTAAALAMPTLASADNTTCANAEVLMIGETASDTAPASGSIYFKTRLVAGRSYSVMTWAPFEDLGEGGADLNAEVYSDSACTTTVSNQGGDTEPNLSFANADGDAVNFIASATGDFRIKVDETLGRTYTVRVAFIETTQFSPWWFAGGTNQAFAEIRNTTQSSISMTLTARGSNGTACGSTTATIPANGNTFISIKPLGTCTAAGFGSAEIAHNGQAGAVVANITTIDAVTAGTSFDAPFAPRMTWAAVFTPR